MRAYGAFTRRMSGCVRRSPSRRPRAARPKTVGDRCGPRVDRHQSKRQTRTAFRLPDATRDSFHEDDTPGAMRSERRKETRARCACEASNAPTMRVHRAGAASGLDQRAQRAKAVSECNERMQRAGRVCGCGERQDGSGIEAQCATATRTPRCRRPASVDRAGPIPTRRAAALRRDRARPFRSARTAARRLPSHRAAHAAATPIGHERRCAPARAPHSRRRAERRRASNRPACAIVHSKPRGRHGSRAHAPSTDAACAPRVGRTGRRAVTPPDTARASAHTARAASTARDRHRARAPRDTASAGRPDARGRPSRDRAAPR